MTCFSSTLLKNEFPLMYLHVCAQSEFTEGEDDFKNYGLQSNYFNIHPCIPAYKSPHSPECETTGCQRPPDCGMK